MSDPRTDIDAVPAPSVDWAAEDALIALAEQEKERIGRELHDGVGQELAGAAFLAKALATRLQAIDRSMAADAEWIKTILARCVEEIRMLSRRLSPTDLEQGDAIAAIGRLCTDAERAYGIRCHLLADDAARWHCAGLGVEPARQLFRICQEAINNATRHGGCRCVRVQLALRKRALRVSVSDDGRGFPVGAAPTGMGIRNMRLRAQSLGGSLRLGRRSGWTHVMIRVCLANGVRA